MICSLESLEALQKCFDAINPATERIIGVAGHYQADVNKTGIGGAFRYDKDMEEDACQRRAKYIYQIARMVQEGRVN